MTAPGSGAVNGFAGPAVTPAPSYSPRARLTGGWFLRGEVVGKPLTARELECLARAAHGLTDQAIAIDMGVAKNTVRNRMTMVLAKLGVQTRIEAFIAMGWLTPPAIEAAA